MTEITDEHIEHLKHKDFKNKKHEEGCTCGYCELKKLGERGERPRREFNKRIKSLKLSKEAIEELFDKFLTYWGSGFRCFYCNRRMDLKFENEYSWTIEHFIPRAKGGKDEAENIEFVCRACNFLKGEMNPEQYINNRKRLKLRKQKLEYWKARKTTKRDKQKRESYKDIFLMVAEKKND